MNYQNSFRYYINKKLCSGAYLLSPCEYHPPAGPGGQVGSTRLNCRVRNPPTPKAMAGAVITGEKRILGASQGRSATARGGVAEFFSRKISVTDPATIKFKKISSKFWRLATLPLRVPSPQQSLTSVFGMRTGVTSAINHQNLTLIFIYCVLNDEVDNYYRPWILVTVAFREGSGFRFATDIIRAPRRHLKLLPQSAIITSPVRRNYSA